jgi:hypothetical protein
MTNKFGNDKQRGYGITNKFGNDKQRGYGMTNNFGNERWIWCVWEALLAEGLPGMLVYRPSLAVLA